MEDAVNILEKFWPLLILIAFFYFSMYRPQKKLRLERKRFLLSLRKGNHSDFQWYLWSYQGIA